MCEFCGQRSSAFVPMNNTAPYSGIEIAMNKDGMLRVRYSSENIIGFDSQDIINIDFCPKCGRKFERDNY